jgi:hypothetical protein
VTGSNGSRSAPACDEARRREGRRPYEKPCILWREPLEAMASECTSVPGGKSDAVCVVAFS